MIPSPWVGLVLALGVYRLVRLIGWDDFPPIARVRGWVTGEQIVTNGSTNARMGLTDEEVTMLTSYRRPILEKFLHCPFCQGFWMSLAVYVCWRLEATWTVTGAAVFALSGAVGLIAKNLDA